MGPTGRKKICCHWMWIDTIFMNQTLLAMHVKKWMRGNTRAILGVIFCLFFDEPRLGKEFLNFKRKLFEKSFHTVFQLWFHCLKLLQHSDCWVGNFPTLGKYTPPIYSSRMFDFLPSKQGFDTSNLDEKNMLVGNPHTTNQGEATFGDGYFETKQVLCAREH